MPLRPSSPRRRRGRAAAASRLLWGVLALAAAVAGVGAARALAVMDPVIGPLLPFGTQLHDRGHLLAILGVWTASYVVLALTVFRLPRRAGTAVAIGAGAAGWVAAVARQAVLSDDLYRYAWDGRVQAAGINPYRYAPADPHLAGLRDSWLWPDAATCAARGRPSGCTLINRPSVHTLYPPLSQGWFRFLHAVLPASVHDRGYEIAGIGLVAVATALLVALLLRLDRDPRLVVLWTACPAVAIEAVQSAHVDALAVVVLLLALLAAAAGRPILAALGIAAGVVVKLYPGIVLPAVVQRRRILAWSIAVIAVVVAYLPFLPGSGGHLSGYLSGYLHEEGYSDGSRFLLLRLVGLSGTPAKVVVLLVLGGLVVAAALRRLGPPDRATLTLLVALVLLANPGEPWGDLLLLALIAVTGRWEWLGVVAAEYVQYLYALLHHDSAFRSTATWAYVAALLLGVAVTGLRVTGYLSVVDEPDRGHGLSRQDAWA